MKMTPIILIIFSISFLLSCQSDDTHQTQFTLKADEKILTLDGTWKFRQGDNPNWTSADFDDSNWQIHPVQPLALSARWKMARLRPGYTQAARTWRLD